MNSKDPIFVEYCQAADAVRCGDESVAAVDRLKKAEAALEAKRRAERAAEAPAKPGWWNLPVAASCWNDDAKYAEQN